MRSHLACSVWKQSHSANPRELIPEENGWERDDTGELIPKLSDQIPAPEAIIELCLCGCTSGCITNKCSCKNNKLGCTDMCRCENCKNNKNEMEEDEDMDVNPKWDNEGDEDI